MPRDLAGLPWPQKHTLAGGGHSMGGKQTWAGPLAMGDRNLPLRTQRKERKGLKTQSCGLESLAWRATPGHITMSLTPGRPISAHCSLLLSHRCLVA